MDSLKKRVRTNDESMLDYVNGVYICTVYIAYVGFHLEHKKRLILCALTYHVNKCVNYVLYIYVLLICMENLIDVHYS